MDSVDRDVAQGSRPLVFRSSCGDESVGAVAVMQRRVLLAAGLLASSSLAACGGLAIFSSGRAKIPDLPALAGGGSIRQLWSSSLPGAVGFQPALAGPQVWAASPNGSVALLDARSGQVRWRIDAGRGLVAGVGTDGQIGVVAGRDGSLIAFGIDGKQRWAVSVGAEIVTVPVVGQGLVVVRSSDNRVSAFDAASGARRWGFQRQAPPLVVRQTGALAVDAAQIYVGLPGGRMLSVASDTGAQRWEAAVSIPRGSNEIERIADIVGTPRLVGNDVCVAAFQGRVACLDIGTGRTLWSRDISSTAGIDVDSQALVVADEKGHIHAFSRTGSSLWRQEKLAGRGLLAPLLAPSHVLIGDSQGVVHLLGRDDGALRARIDLGKPMSGPAVRVDSVALLQTQDGALHALGFE